MLFQVCACVCARVCVCVCVCVYERVKIPSCILLTYNQIAGADPYYDAPGGRGTGVAMEPTERMMDVDRRDHPMEEEPTERISIASKLQSFDYSHGSTNLKTVDYNHGGSSDAPAAQAYQDSTYPSLDLAGYGGAGREVVGYPYEGYQYPGGGGYPPGAGSFLPAGLDAATLFAAYASQTGIYNYRPHTCMFSINTYIHNHIMQLLLLFI